MATTTASAYNVHLTPQEAGVFHYKGINEDAALKASDLLQENHRLYNMYFNDSGFHNHIVHHLLAVYSLGAPPSLIQKAYDDNAGYQRPALPVDKSIVNKLGQAGGFKDYLGKRKHYPHFLTFFQKQIDIRGYENVVNEYIFKGDAQANDLMGRLFAGFLHPVIHLGYGIEFKQPVIVAEALAQTCTHDNWINKILFATEKAAKERKEPSAKSLVEIIDEIHASKTLRGASHWDDPNKIQYGILKRAPDEMAQVASQWTVRPDQLEEKTAEMINATAYFTGACLNPRKEIKFDFFHMHCLNSSLFFSAFLEQDWIARENKARLLQFKGWTDLVLYTAHTAPDLHLEEITKYQPKEPIPASEEEGWARIFKRVTQLHDDGHANKFIRALANGHQVCKPYEDKDSFKLKGDMWLKLANMVMDSVEGAGSKWVFNAGFDEAWEQLEDRA